MSGKKKSANTKKVAPPPAAPASCSGCEQMRQRTTLRGHVLKVKFSCNLDEHELKGNILNMDDNCPLAVADVAEAGEPVW